MTMANYLVPDGNGFQPNHTVVSPSNEIVFPLVMVDADYVVSESSDYQVNHSEPMIIGTDRVIPQESEYEVSYTEPVLYDTDYVVPSDVQDVLHLGYHVIIPACIVVGLICNAAYFLLLFRPKLRKLHITQYLRFMVIVNILGLVACIPANFFTGYCTYRSYAAAFYHSHFGWILVNCFRYMNLYILVWLTYNRALGIWSPKQFLRAKETGVAKMRLTFTMIWVLIVDMVAVISGQVKTHETEQGETVYISVPEYDLHVEDIGISVSRLYSNHIMVLLANASKGYNEDLIELPNSPLLSSGKWFKCYRIFLTWVFQVIPGTVLISLSAILVVGILKNKVRRSSDSGNTVATVFATLIVNMLFVLCSLPYTLFSVILKTENKCYGNANYEKALYILNLLQMTWSIVNIVVFLLMNKECRDEIRLIFKSIKLKCICKTPRKNKMFTKVPHIIVEDMEKEVFSQKSRKSVTWAISKDDTPHRG